MRPRALPRPRCPTAGSPAGTTNTKNGKHPLSPPITTTFHPLLTPSLPQRFYVNTYTKKSQWEKPTEPAQPPHDDLGAPPGYTPGSTPAPSDTKVNPYDNNNHNHGGGAAASYLNSSAPGSSAGQHNPNPNDDEDARLARQLQAEEDARAAHGGSPSYQQGQGGFPGQLPPRPDDKSRSGGSGGGLLGKIFGGGKKPSSGGSGGSHGGLPGGLGGLLAGRGGGGGHHGGGGFGGAPGGYGAPPGGYGAPPGGYGAPGGYGQPQQGYYPPQQHGYGGGGGYAPQGGYYPPQQHGYGQQHGGYKKSGGSGLGMAGGAALGVGAGVLGGVLIADAINDSQQEAYQEGYGEYNPHSLLRKREVVMIMMANVWVQRTVVVVILMVVVTSKGVWMRQWRVEGRKETNGLLTSWCGRGGIGGFASPRCQFVLFDFAVSVS